ncbi:caspase activity and apoptosis inhibitor 1 isoform X2 [Clupea harengus]|uniref:Caspase activity and apoptosis inhibitor 1 isoform X2 n=1 Tax=Clupea harengus TaxID=7950 RepID=A0A6P3W0E6_CLUHA|nr:caspase activity and apoptosis inhibitor 1 isoform X2 [Clupea harengus]
MLGKKSVKDKKRRHAQGESREVGRKRRSTDSSAEDAKEDLEQAEAPVQESSDVEEGGLDLSVPFKPISAYVSDRQEMLEQCFRVLGENKLKKMLPDDLKDVPFEEIKKLCWEQLEQLSSNNLLEILEGREVTEADDAENKNSSAADSQQDNNVDSTSSVKESSEVDEVKQGGGSGDESDVLSINADVDDSDIEGPKEDKPQEVEEESAAVPPTTPPVEEEKEEKMEEEEKKKKKEDEPRLELQQDIERSVSEILALSVAAEPPPPPPKPAPPVGAAAAAQSRSPQPQLADLPSALGVTQPSAQQLELLELEMRARAIKALMKANETKKQALAP